MKKLLPIFIYTSQKIFYIYIYIENLITTQQPNLKCIFESLENLTFPPKLTFRDMRKRRKKIFYIIYFRFSSRFMSMCIRSVYLMSYDLLYFDQFVYLFKNLIFLIFKEQPQL